MKAFVATACAALALSACAGAVPWNPQGYAGINLVEAEFEVPENAAGPTRLRILGGKEQESVAFKASLPDGTVVEYGAAGVGAFDGQRVRAAVEEAVSKDAREASPGIVDAIMKAVSGAVLGDK